MNPFAQPDAERPTQEEFDEARKGVGKSVQQQIDDLTRRVEALEADKRFERVSRSPVDKTGRPL